jgi:predicted dehydrogenase
MSFNVGIIGYDLSAKVFHIPYILQVPEFKLKAICQRRPTPENDAAKDFPESKIHSSTDDLINDASVDVVILCTPPASHLALGKQCLEARKHGMVSELMTCDL